MKNNWIKPEIIATFTEEELTKQKDESMFVGDWRQLIWGKA